MAIGPIPSPPPYPKVGDACGRGKEGVAEHFPVGVVDDFLRVLLVFGAIRLGDIQLRAYV